MRINKYLNTNVFAILLSACLFLAGSVQAQRKMENLGRGVVAARTSGSQVYVGWRLLATDPEGVTFNVYRNNVKITPSPVAVTNLVDNTRENNTKYAVHAVIDGVEQKAPAAVSTWSNPYLTIPLQVPAGGTTPPYSFKVINASGDVVDDQQHPNGQSYTYSPNDASVGDLDGDGEYEIVVKWYPSNARDNSQGGFTGNTYLDAYKMDGTHMWRIDLGKNIRSGAHYTQFIVYDLDSDGKAEIAVKTAPNTKDGTGNYLSMGPAANDDDEADYRTGGGWPGFITSGPEYLTIFNGETGAEMATTEYVPDRAPADGWGNTRDNTNRVDRFLAGVGYFDGVNPSLLMARGYYGRSVLVAWDWRNGALTERWKFDTNDAGNEAYAGQGYHSLSIADLDGDGKDEVFYGSMAVDHNGARLWNTGLGHGDAMHVTDLDPDRPGLESWTSHECEPCYRGQGLRFRDAATGEELWGVETTGDIGRAMAADIDPAHDGYEMWGSAGGLYNTKGDLISTKKPGAMNFGIWWDADLQRELFDGSGSNRHGTIFKWNPSTEAQTPILEGSRFNAVTNNGSKATPALTGDILGDWREEVILRTQDNRNLIIFSPVFESPYSLYTLMHDPMYRVAVAWQNVAYNQPPYPSYYLGTGMDTENPPRTEIAAVGEGPALVDPPLPTGVKKDGAESSINIFPNPSGGLFFIKAEGAFKYSIYDQLGKVLESGTGTGAKGTGAGLSAGIYILKVETKSENKTSWIIKQ